MGLFDTLIELAGFECATASGGTPQDACSAIVDNSGYVAAAKNKSNATDIATNIRRITAVTIALFAAKDAINAYRRMYKLQSEALGIVEDRFNFKVNLYWPRELQFLQDYASNMTPIRHPEIYSRRIAKRLVASVAAQHADAVRTLQLGMGRYTASFNQQSILELEMVKAKQLSTARLGAHAAGWRDWSERMEQRWASRFTAVNLAQGMVDTAVKGLIGASENYARVGRMFMGEFSQAVYDFGRAREDSVSSWSSNAVLIDSYNRVDPGRQVRDNGATGATATGWSDVG